MKEYEVELEFSSAMTAYPDRRRTGGEEYRDGEAPQLGSQSDLSSEMWVNINNSLTPIPCHYTVQSLYNTIFGYTML